MKKIIECIPNFSEGRSKETIETIIKAITSTPGIFLLDRESDPAHNRSVVTFAGEPEAVVEGAFRGCKKASELIDMDKHKGEHPRMGAMDVCPLVPLKGITDEECLPYAEKLAERIGNELQIPVYLYEKSSLKPERENLADVRKGQYEGIKAEIETNSERKPDYGPSKMPKAGATAIGVRAPLVAYNVNLKTIDLNVAKAIAKKIRFRDGGFPCVKAMGFNLADREMVQVSMNLTDYRVTPVHTVFEAISKECVKHGVEIEESEVIGLIPQDALSQASQHFLKIKNFSNKQILEQILQEKMAGESAENFSNIEDFLNKVASKSPVPGGGSVSALAGALAAALASMVANLTITSKKYESVHVKIAKILKETEKLRHRLFELIAEDAQAYEAVVKAYKTKNPRKIQESLKKAALSPLEIAKTAAALAEPIKILTKEGNQNASSDCGVALHLMEAAIKGAVLNIEINLKYIEDKSFVESIKEKITKLSGQTA